MTSASQSVLRLEWLSYPDYLDVLQSQNQIQPHAWTDVETFLGTGETLTKDIPANEAAGYYRLQRELR